MANVATALSTRIKELRESEGLTQQAFAKEFKISKQTVSNYENNERTPDVNLMLEISRHFNVSMDYLTGNSEIKNQGLVSVNNRLQELNDVMEHYSEVEFIKQNVIDILNDFLDLALRHVTNNEILRGYADILKLINLHDLFLTEAYSSPKILEGAEVVKYVDGMSACFVPNSAISEKELDTTHNIAKKLLTVNSNYFMRKCESSFCGPLQLDED